MSIVVTGGAGFLGRHLVQNLLDGGHQVIVLDSLWTGSRENVRCFTNRPSYRFLQHDVRDPLPDLGRIKEIYHLACPASPDHFETDPIDILETCYQGTKNILDLAVRNNAKVLVASTSEIYGDPEVAVQSERYFGNVNSFGPRSCYDEGKRVAEALCYSYQSAHDLEIRVARIFNAYGPFMEFDDGRAVPNFIAAAMEGRSITIYGDGYATRCFQHATDCIRGLMLLMASEYRGPVNIGSDHEVPVIEVAHMVAGMVATKLGHPSTVSIDLLPKREDDPVRRKPDISLAWEKLRWKPEMKLDAGIESTVDWFLQKNQFGDSLQSVRPAL